MKNSILFVPFAFLAMSCSSGSGSGRPARDTIISSAARQSELTHNLSGLVPDEWLQQDSVVVMILPLEASCPSCRDKTIDSIMFFRDKIPPHHYIVLSARAGKKTMRGFFKGAGHDGIPEIPGVLLYDSSNLAGKRELYRENPAIYFLDKGKVHRKVYTLPHTVKEDLREFFRGYRLNQE